jgi:hypothetical protein
VAGCGRFRSEIVSAGLLAGHSAQTDLPHHVGAAASPNLPTSVQYICRTSKKTCLHEWETFIKKLQRRLAKEKKQALRLERVYTPKTNTLHVRKQGANAQGTHLQRASISMPSLGERIPVTTATPCSAITARSVSGDERTKSELTVSTASSSRVICLKCASADSGSCAIEFAVDAMALGCDDVFEVVLAAVVVTVPSTRGSVAAAAPADLNVLCSPIAPVPVDIARD